MITIKTKSPHGKMQMICIICGTELKQHEIEHHWCNNEQSRST